MVEQGEVDAVDRLEQRQLYLLANKSVVIDSAHKTSLRNLSAVNAEWDQSRADRELKFAQRHALEAAAKGVEAQPPSNDGKPKPPSTSKPPNVRPQGGATVLEEVAEEEQEEEGTEAEEVVPEQGGTSSDEAEAAASADEKEAGGDPQQQEADEPAVEKVRGTRGQLTSGTQASAAVLEEQIQKAVADERARVSAETSRTLAELQYALQQQVTIAQQERERARTLEAHAQREAARAQQLERDTRTLRDDVLSLKHEIENQTEKLQKQSEDHCTAEDKVKKRERRRRRKLKEAIAALEKRQQEKNSLAFRQTKLWLSMSARVVETAANATNFNLVRLRGLAADLDTQLEKGTMDAAISSYADSQSALTFLTDPLASLVANLLNVVTETHLSNLEEEKTAVPTLQPAATQRARPQPVPTAAATHTRAGESIPEPIRHSIHGGVPPNLLARREQVDFVAPRPNALIQRVSSTVGALAPLLVSSKANEELDVERRKLEASEND